MVYFGSVCFASIFDNTTIILLINMLSIQTDTNQYKKDETHFFSLPLFFDVAIDTVLTDASWWRLHCHLCPSEWYSLSPGKFWGCSCDKRTRFWLFVESWCFRYQLHIAKHVLRRIALRFALHCSLRRMLSACCYNSEIVTTYILVFLNFLMTEFYVI